MEGETQNLGRSLTQGDVVYTLSNLFTRKLGDTILQMLLLQILFIQACLIKLAALT